MQLLLKLVTGEEMVFDIRETTFLIGRSNRCDVVIPHEGVSRQHCKVEIVGGHFFITDLDSTNGVFIDGEKIETGIKTPFFSSLTLSFGAVESACFKVGKLKVSPIQKIAEINTDNIELEDRTYPGRYKIKKRKWVEKEERPPFGSGPLSAMNFLVAVIVVGGIFWYFSQEKAPIIIDSEVISDGQ